MKKKLVLFPLLTLALAGSLTGCSTAKEIGILQYGEIPALDKAREGFVDALKARGYDTNKIDYKNAETKASNVSTFADAMIGRYKLNLAIATPCATMMKATALNIGNTSPLLFTAVTDPTDGLVSNVYEPEGFVTGSSDMQPSSALIQQIQLAKKINPEITKFGILYTASETNSKIQADSAEAIAQLDGLEVVRKTCTNNNDVEEKTIALVNEGVGAIWIPTDTNVSNNISKVKSGIGDKKVLLIAGEDGMLSSAHVTISINYYNLGYKTGEMAAGILLDGKTVKQTPVFYPTLDECAYEYNSVNLTAAGFSVDNLPKGYNWIDVA